MRRTGAGALLVALVLAVPLLAVPFLGELPDDDVQHVSARQAPTVLGIRRIGTPAGRCGRAGADPDDDAAVDPARSAERAV